MSNEFLDLAEISPVGEDELLLVRGGVGKRANLSTILSAGTSAQIAIGQTPPTDTSLWWEVDTSGNPIEFWMLKPGGHWVSVNTWSISEFEFEVKRNWAWAMPNPCPSSDIWIEDFTARAYAQDTITGNNYIDFELKAINSQQQKTTLFYLRVSNISSGSLFYESEKVDQLINASDALGLWLSITRQGFKKLKTASLTATIRKVRADA